MKRLARDALALIAIFGAIPLTACIPLPPEVRVALNANTGEVAQANLAAGLPHAEVWCWSEESSPTNDTYIVTAVDSSDLLRYGSCRGIIGRGYGAVTCDFVVRFCRIFPETPPATTTVTWVDYPPAGS